MFHVEQTTYYMTAEEVKKAIRNVPDFPIPGIQFKDITTALDKPECLKWMRDEIVKTYKNKGITKVVGIESRGFIIAPAVAMEIGAGFVPIRKHNKLPAETVSVTYAKEYGDDTIQIHKDAVKFGSDLGLRFALVYGGVDYDTQRELLQRANHVPEAVRRFWA